MREIWLQLLRSVVLARPEHKKRMMNDSKKGLLLLLLVFGRLLCPERYGGALKTNGGNCIAIESSRDEIAGKHTHTE